MSNINNMPEIIDNMPNICGKEKEIEQATKPSAKNYYAPVSNINLDKVQGAFSIALHMHQPMIPAGGYDLRSAQIISNLKNMMDNQHIGDNHNAPTFRDCYVRMSRFILDLANRGKNPRIMLDYSGNLLWGLRQMGDGWVLDDLKKIACDPKYFRYVEWLGTTWSHAVVTSTPVPDVKLHIRAWQHNFASIFGFEALERVKGFSPPEMHLPIHPDICYEYVKALKECGYRWLMVQEHTIEKIDGSGINLKHVPHRLVAKNSEGKVEEIAVLIKTQGSDTKLVAQMQPVWEAKGLPRINYCGKDIPQCANQIGDGENGGVMMNEFPKGYYQEFENIGTEGLVGLNGSEYLELLKEKGISEKDFIPVQPISQKRIWDNIGKPKKGAADEAIDAIKAKDHGYNLDKGSWTSNISWVKGYENVLDPINKLSAVFHAKVETKKINTSDAKYREALTYVLLSQTSCFRYWGQGLWTEYAKEICRRGMEKVEQL
ncbi:MAG: glycosyl hydrolase family 57 [Candidatus Omnitrophica bacterium]|nr:glycosyl hydrolase family 57 [Candidatus Omnitrophota bacterium]